VQIAEELTRRPLPAPAPVSALVPTQATSFRTPTGSPSQVPPEWTRSGSDLLAAAMQFEDEHEHPGRSRNPPDQPS
jgi:hypothetical protein